MPAMSSSDRLAEYRRKRAADRTPEPFDEGARGGAGIFVVQKHAATRLHYDLRLEHDGVLMSWAVPMGISHDPQHKRFAVHTEDHPIEYADFEGVIPADEYGGGEMIVWDRGSLTWDEDPDKGLKSGKLLFTLHGYKLHGQWTLVELKKEPNGWLLIKHSDGWVRLDETDPPSEASILTGQTIEDLATGHTPSSEIVKRLTTADCPKGAVDGPTVDLMLANTADGPFSNDGWVFEIKYDGYRMVAHKDGRSVRLRYRSGLDATAIFPDVTSALRRIPVDRFVVDGEVTVLDDDGRPSFQLLQRRGRISNQHDVTAAAARTPATFFAFDVLAFEDYDLRSLPLTDRKEVLGTFMPAAGPLRYTEHLVGVGEAMFDQVVTMGLEGIMAKRADSHYVAGRSDAWLKVKAERTDTFAVVGFTHPKGSRTGVGALLIALLSDGVLTYAGRVGSGFTDATLTDLRDQLDGTIEPAPRVAGDTPTSSEYVWTQPTLSCVVRYKEITDVGSLRQPVFVSYGALDLDEVVAIDGGSEPPPPGVIDARTTEPTNVDKLFWPDDGFTKGDLIDYYTAVSDHLLPYLADRPVVLDRYPDGIDGKSFFQKNAPEFVPDWVRTQWIGDDGKGNTYFVVDDVESLRFLANLASIPLHVWASRLERLDRPDWCILDLDPKDAPFSSVVTTARVIKDVCDAMDVPCYPKTSGKTGLHVLIPMGAAAGYDQQKMLGELVARVVESRVGDIATTVRNPRGRDGKVYIDFLQNGKGKLLVSPYSVRPVRGATVSAPLRWREVTQDLDISAFTITTLPRRLKAMKDDPLAGVLTERPDIVGGLAKLASAM